MHHVPARGGCLEARRPLRSGRRPPPEDLSPRRQPRRSPGRLHPHGNMPALAQIPGGLPWDLADRLQQSGHLDGGNIHDFLTTRSSTSSTSTRPATTTPTASGSQMDKRERATFDYCADLLSLRQNEGFMRLLMRSDAGAWLSVADAARTSGVQPPPHSGLREDLRVTWLVHPTSGDGDAVVVFYSPDTMWSTLAIYNRARLG